MFFTYLWIQIKIFFLYFNKKKKVLKPKQLRYNTSHERLRGEIQNRIPLVYIQFWIFYTYMILSHVSSPVSHISQTNNHKVVLYDLWVSFGLCIKAKTIFFCWSGYDILSCDLWILKCFVDKTIQKGYRKVFIKRLVKMWRSFGNRFYFLGG